MDLMKKAFVASMECFAKRFDKPEAVVFIGEAQEQTPVFRTETTIDNTRDFSIGKRLCNLPALRQVDFQANRRVLEVERLSQSCAVGKEAMLKLNRPVPPAALCFRQSGSAGTTRSPHEARALTHYSR
jgi:hypothetical protein